jgi:hypothetical protein
MLENYKFKEMGQQMRPSDLNVDDTIITTKRLPYITLETVPIGSIGTVMYVPCRSGRWTLFDATFDSLNTGSSPTCVEFSGAKVRKR